MMEKHEFVSRGMERVRKAIKDAPSHLEVEAAIEAAFLHMTNPEEDFEEPKPDPARQAAVVAMHANLATRP